MATREDLLDRISVDPQVCFGRPCIRGTRVWVSLIVDNLAAGVDEAEILEAYPQLEPEDTRAALAYSRYSRCQVPGSGAPGSDA